MSLVVDVAAVDDVGLPLMCADRRSGCASGELLSLCEVYRSHETSFGNTGARQSFG